MATRIAVLDASLGDTPAERNLTREIDVTTTVFKVSDGEFPPAVDGDWPFDGIVISGSQSSVYEDRSWIARLTEWFRTAQTALVPALGICWGHQFIAQALGGRVVAMDEYELGYTTIDRYGPDPVMAQIPASFVAFETHSDRVAELPPGAVPLAGNATGVQAFRAGTAVGVQFHPEYDRRTAEMVTQRKESVSEERIEAVLADITERRVAEAEAAKRVFDGFVDYVDTFDRTQALKTARRDAGQIDTSRSSGRRR